MRLVNVLKFRYQFSSINDKIFLTRPDNLSNFKAVEQVIIKFLTNGNYFKINEGIIMHQKSLYVLIM